MILLSRPRWEMRGQFTKQELGRNKRSFVYKWNTWRPEEVRRAKDSPNTNREENYKFKLRKKRNTYWEEKYKYKSGGRSKIRGEENTFFLFTVREVFLAKGPPTIRLPWYWSCKEGFPQLNYAIIDFRSCGISHSRFFWYMLSFRWTYFGMRSFWLIKAVKILPTDFLLEIFFGFSWSKSFGWSKW